MSSERRLNLVLASAYTFAAIVVALDLFLWRPL
jgi:hypothetical protein